MGAWDARPVRLEHPVTKELAEFFYRSAVAKALNRKVVTIRSWELKGIFPHPLLRTSNDVRYGRWLYSREQIEALIKLADQEGVLNPNYKNRFTQRFVDEAHQIIGRLPK